MVLKKAEFIGNVANSASLSKADTERALSAITNEITNCLQNGESLAIAGLGTFSTYDRAARKGRNPRDGSEITIPASVGIRFKPAKNLKDAVN